MNKPYYVLLLVGIVLICYGSYSLGRKKIFESYIITKPLERQDWWVLGFKFDCPNDTPIAYINGSWYGWSYYVNWGTWNLSENWKDWHFWCNDTNNPLGCWRKVTYQTYLLATVWSGWNMCQYTHFNITGNLVIAYGKVPVDGIRRVVLQNDELDYLVITIPNLDGTFCLIYQEVYRG